MRRTSLILILASSEMAIVWEKRVNKRLYQVRRAGGSLRLYTDGTFHSQYNPRWPLNGSIWDLLVLPALFRPEKVRRVLVLGVGGGAVIRQLEQLVQPESIVGVELDPVHLRIAHRHFGLNQLPTVSLVEADARKWLQAYSGPAFDLIIDDLFGENGSSPERAVALDAEWSRQLLAALSSSGVLVVNTESARALGRSALRSQSKIRQQFKASFSLSVPGYENRIGAFFKEAVAREELAANLKKLESEFGSSLTRRLRARIRRL